MLTVSIITPSYNQSTYLEQTILSVINQGYPALEYCIVDGFSTDNSVEIIKKYENKLTWWISEKDKGQADAINKGLRGVNGEIVAWINSDDLYFPGAIKAAAETFECNKEAGIVFGDVASIDKNGNIFNLQTFKSTTLPDLMSFNIISQPAVFMRRSILDKIGNLDPEYHFLLDHHLWIRIARIATLNYIPKTLAAARYHIGAKNIAHANQFGSEAYRIVDWMQSSPDFAPIFSEYQRRIFAGAHRLNAYYLTEDGQAYKALISYLRSFVSHPKPIFNDWRHFLLTIFSLLGLKKIGTIYRMLRRGKFKALKSI